MRITQRQLRQIIKEEIFREMRRDEPSGYEYLSELPSTIVWRDGPVDRPWVQKMLSTYQESFPNSLPMMARDFIMMLDGIPLDPDIVARYIDRETGLSRHTRQTFEALVAALQDPDNKPAPPHRSYAGPLTRRYY